MIYNILIVVIDLIYKVNCFFFKYSYRQRNLFRFNLVNRLGKSSQFYSLIIDIAIIKGYANLFNFMFILNWKLINMFFT